MDRDECAGLVWVDIETTGLDVKIDAMLEIAVIVTDLDLNEIAGTRRNHVLRWRGNLDTVHPAVVAMHGGDGSGLWRECAYSSKLSHHIDVELRDLLVALGNPDSQWMLAGSSVHFDRLFIAKHLPRFDMRLHYRHLDVSVLINTAQWWADTNLRASGESKHRAMSGLERSLHAAREAKRLLERT